MNLFDLRNQENLFDPNQNYGPLELNILEKIENSLSSPNFENNKNKKFQKKKKNFSKKKFYL